MNETHAANVVNNADPLKRGRIQVTCVGLMGDGATPLPHWIEPAYEWGWFAVPDVGEIVDIVAVTGTDTDEVHGQSYIDAPDLKWKGRHWGNAEAETAKRPVPEDFTAQNYGKRRGFATPWGHVLLFDDTPDAPRVSLTMKVSDGKFSYLGLDKDGCVFGNSAGSMVNLSSKNGELTMIDQSGNMYTSKGDSVTVANSEGAFLNLKGKDVQIIGDGAVINAKSVQIKAADITLGDGAIDAILKGTSFMVHYLAHTHSSAGAGPLIPTGAEALLLSSYAKVF